MGGEEELLIRAMGEEGLLTEFEDVVFSFTIGSFFSGQQKFCLVLRGEEKNSVGDFFINDPSNEVIIIQTICNGLHHRILHGGLVFDNDYVTGKDFVPQFIKFLYQPLFEFGSGWFGQGNETFSVPAATHSLFCGGFAALGERRGVHDT